MAVSHVRRRSDDIGAGVGGRGPGAVGRTVINDNDFEFAAQLRQSFAVFVNHVGDGTFFVEGRDDYRNGGYAHGLPPKGAREEPAHETDAVHRVRRHYAEDGH